MQRSTDTILSGEQELWPECWLTQALGCNRVISACSGLPHFRADGTQAWILSSEVAVFNMLCFCQLFLVVSQSSHCDLPDSSISIWPETSWLWSHQRTRSIRRRQINYVGESVVLQILLFLSIFGKQMQKKVSKQWLKTVCKMCFLYAKQRFISPLELGFTSTQN